MREIYLDNSSTSFPKAPGVGEAMRRYVDCVGVNVARGGYSRAYDAGEMVYETRETLASFFGLSRAQNVVFVPSVTAALNYVIRGLLKPGDHVITSKMEHNAVARPLTALSGSVEADYIACDMAGRMDLAAFRAAFRENTRLVILSHASNVCGTVQDIAEIGRICLEKGVFFVVDTAQSAGTISIDMEKLHISGLAVPGHKGLMGPQGIGALLLTDALADAMEPLICGGTGSRSDLLAMPPFLPDKFEAGTLNLPGIAGLKTALEFLKETGTETIRARELTLARRLAEGMAAIPGVRVLGAIGEAVGPLRSAGEGTEARKRWDAAAGNAAGNVASGHAAAGTDSGDDYTAVVSVVTDRMDMAETAGRLADEFGVMTRCGLHCAPLAHRTLGTFPEGTIRFSPGFFTTEEEIDAALAAMRRLLG